MLKEANQEINPKLQEFALKYASWGGNQRGWGGNQRGGGSCELIFNYSYYFFHQPHLLVDEGVDDLTNNGRSRKIKGVGFSFAFIDFCSHCRRKTRKTATSQSNGLTSLAGGAGEKILSNKLRSP